jgi:hypothetical protein
MLTILFGGQSGKVEVGRLRLYEHHHARPKGMGGFVIPRVYDARANMLALRGDFVAAGGFPDGDCQV